MWPFAGGLGARGERIAAKHLCRQGWKILARNFRCPAGEVDLIALEPAAASPFQADTLVFVEVKTRSDDSYASPASAVNDAKERKIHAVADSYLAARDTTDYPIRFDVISVVTAPGREPKIQHDRDAF